VEQFYGICGVLDCMTRFVEIINWLGMYNIQAINKKDYNYCNVIALIKYTIYYSILNQW